MENVEHKGNRYLYLKNFNNYRLQTDSKILTLENSLYHLKSETKRLRVFVTVLTIILTSVISISFIAK